jgi:thioredoxin 1
MSENIAELNDENWEEKIEKSDTPFVVMFSSPACPYCKQMKPYFEEYASEYKDKIAFAEVDISKSPTIANRYGVMGTPTFKFFCHGKPVYELVGAVHPHMIKHAVHDALEHGTACVNSTTWKPPETSPYS